MFSINPTLESDIRREEMLREAQKQRLIREAQSAKNTPRPTIAKWLRIGAALLIINPK